MEQAAEMVAEKENLHKKVSYTTRQGFIWDFWWRGRSLWGMHEYETIQIFKFSWEGEAGRGKFQRPLPIPAR